MWRVCVCARAVRCNVLILCFVDVLDENQSKLSEDLMEFRRDASMLNVSQTAGDMSCCFSYPTLVLPLF